MRHSTFCTSNFPKNQTLNCLPDFLAQPNSQGEVTVVVGIGDAVKKAAEGRGYSFLPDSRKAAQRVMGFVYRNLVPEKSFSDQSMFRDTFAPTAVVCSRAEFLTQNCGN